MSKTMEYTFTEKPGPKVWVQQVGPQAQLRLVEDKLQRSVQFFLEFISVKGATTRSIELTEDEGRALRDYSDEQLQCMCRKLAEDPRAEKALRILSSIAADLSGHGLSAPEWDTAGEDLDEPALLSHIEPGRVYGKAKVRLATNEDVLAAIELLMHVPTGIVGQVLVRACARRDAAGAPVQVWLDKELQQLVFRDANARLISAGQAVKEILREHYRLKTPGTKL